MFLFKVISIVMMVLLSNLGISSASLIVNGGFEGGTYSVTEGSVPYEVPVGWTYEHNAKSYNFGVRNSENPLDGYYFSFAQEGGTGTLSQQLSTINAQTYTVIFWLYSNPGVSPIYPGNDMFSVTWGNNILINQVDSPKFDWTFFSFTMLADSAMTNLAFTGGNTGGGYHLDNVSVSGITNVPEPLTILLLAIGLTSLAGCRWKFDKA